jgi:DNA-3-methyladenine glycosylase I
MAARGLTRGDDGRLRCAWAEPHADYRDYHDAEWGRPVADDTRLFEKLCLEGFQAGLSWLTILRKRENFRRAFRGFEIDAVARFNTRSVARLLADPGIVRHRGKIEAAIQNARCACKLASQEGSLAAYLWRFEPGPEERPRRVTAAGLRALTESPASRALAGDLRGRGFRFVGPTTVYALMQAMGLVDDHLEGCVIRPEVERARRRFRRPRSRQRALRARRPPPPAGPRSPRPPSACPACPPAGPAPRPRRP